VLFVARFSLSIFMTGSSHGFGIDLSEVFDCEVLISYLRKAQ
jgi:hypothetical protein